MLIFMGENEVLWIFHASNFNTNRALSLNKLNAYKDSMWP